jgi:hypothetical protein
MEPEFMKNMLSTSTSQKTLPNTSEIMLCRFAASPIFVHFDVRYVIFRRVPAMFEEFLQFSQTQLRELQTSIPLLGMTHP